VADQLRDLRRMRKQQSSLASLPCDVIRQSGAVAVKAMDIHNMSPKQVQRESPPIERDRNPTLALLVRPESEYVSGLVTDARLVVSGPANATNVSVVEEAH
jgi:hypothetical protein